MPHNLVQIMEMSVLLGSILTVSRQWLRCVWTRLVFRSGLTRRMFISGGMWSRRSCIIREKLPRKTSETHRNFVCTLYYSIFANALPFAVELRLVYGSFYENLEMFHFSEGILWLFLCITDWLRPNSVLCKYAPHQRRYNNPSMSTRGAVVFRDNNTTPPWNIPASQSFAP